MADHCSVEMIPVTGTAMLQDVRDKMDHLTTQQRVGLKYFDDFEQRIPRDEVTEAERIVHDVVADSLQVSWAPNMTKPRTLHPAK